MSRLAWSWNVGASINCRRIGRIPAVIGGRQLVVFAFGKPCRFHRRIIAFIISAMRCGLRNQGSMIVMICAIACLTACQTPAPSGIDEMIRGQLLSEQGMTDAALSAFDEALRRDPTLVDAHMSIGDIHRRRGDYAQAVPAYESAADLAPTRFASQYLAGLMNHLSGRVEKAVDWYLRALAIHPEDYDANANLSAAYIQIGRAGDAVAFADQAVKAQPQQQGAWANLGTARSLSGDAAGAVDAFRQAARLGEISDPIVLGLAGAHIKLGYYDRALAALETQARRQPNATLFERIGFVRFMQRRYDESLLAFRKAVELDSRDSAALNGVGVCLMTLYLTDNQRESAHRDEAIDAWRRSLAIRPNQPKIADLLARYARM